ncbi:hypothetical protein JCM3766R1_000282 [Sporobolomyces carnicolor]
MAQPAGTDSARPRTPRPGELVSNPASHYQQQPHVQAQPKAHRSGIPRDVQPGHPLAQAQSKARDATGPTPSHQPPPPATPPNAYFSPYPFPASEHPLPPRTVNRPGPQLSVPLQPGQSDSAPCSTTSFPFAQVQGLGQSPSTSHVLQPQSIEYRFPLGLPLLDARYASSSQFVHPAYHPLAFHGTPTHLAQQTQMYPFYAYSNAQYAMPSSHAATAAGQGPLTHPHALTPFVPTPIRHLESGPFLRATSDTPPRSHPEPHVFEQRGRNLQRLSASLPATLAPPPGLPLPRQYPISADSSPTARDGLDRSPSRPRSCVQFSGDCVRGPEGDSDHRVPVSSDQRTLSLQRAGARTTTGEGPRPSSVPGDRRDQSPCPSKRATPVHQLPSPPTSPSPPRVVLPSPSATAAIVEGGEVRSPRASPSSSRRRRSYSSPAPETRTVAARCQLCHEPSITLPSVGGVLAATEDEEEEEGSKPCDVEGCPFPRFCCLSPCGCRICRDHLGTVIRRVRVEPKLATVVGVPQRHERTYPSRHRLPPGREVLGQGGGGEHDRATTTRRDVDAPNEVETEQMVKIFECVNCKKRSEMVGPTPSQRQQQRSVLPSVDAGSRPNAPIGLGIEFGSPGHYHGDLRNERSGGGNDHGGSFSIHYFSSGPMGGVTRRHVDSSLPGRTVPGGGSGEEGRGRDGSGSGFEVASSFVQPDRARYAVGLIPRPPSPPFPFSGPTQSYSLSSSPHGVSFAGGGGQTHLGPPFELRETLYQTPLEAPAVVSSTANSLEVVSEMRGEDAREELEGTRDRLVVETKLELTDGDGDDDEDGRTLTSNATKPTSLSALASTETVNLSTSKERDKVEAVANEPPARSSPPVAAIDRPASSYGSVPSASAHHATREDAVHLLEDDPSIVCVSSSSPPSTPPRHRRSRPFDPLAQEVPSPSPALPSPRPTSEYFANYSWAPPASPLSGRGSGRNSRATTRGGRGGVYASRGPSGRGRGVRRLYDPAVHGPYRSPSERRRASFASTSSSSTTMAATAIEEETGSVLPQGKSSDWDWSPDEKRGGGETLESQLDTYESKAVVAPELRSRFYAVKVENIPFRTTYAEVAAWLPPDVLPSFTDCPQPIHLILHRAEGRTLPHCYVEIKDREAAMLVLTRCDRTSLGHRTVRVRMERVGELMRDLFDQSAYFPPADEPRNLAREPLPSFPAEGYSLPDKLLTANDLRAFSNSFASTASLTRFFGSLSRDRGLPWLQLYPRPAERAYTHLGSILLKFPYVKHAQQWDTDLRDRLYILSCRAISLANAAKGYHQNSFASIALRLTEIVSTCPGFTPTQRSRGAALSIEEFPPLSSTTQPSPQAERSSPWHRTLSSGETSHLRSSSGGASGAPVRPEERVQDPASGTSATAWHAWGNPAAALGPSTSEGSRESAAGSVRPPALARHSPAVSIPRANWIELTSQDDKTPKERDTAFAADDSAAPSSFSDYPLTPPESPENTRPRFAKTYGEPSSRPK